MARTPDLVRQEMYCQNRVAGMGVGAAYAAVGYKADHYRASQMERRPAVMARIAELQKIRLERRTITIDWVLNQVLPLVEAAHEGPLRPADKIAAATLVCRLSGFLVRPTMGEERQPAEALEVRQLTPAEAKNRWADGIEEAAAHYGTDSVRELVARMRMMEDVQPTVVQS